jgi:hypothetical protein
MGYMKELDIRIRNGGDDAVAAVQRIGEDWRLQLEAAAGEVERLRSQPCPYVTGTVTRYCTLTPFTLTDEEREAVRFFSKIDGPHNVPVANKRAATLRGLLERLAT